jgi:hypothetical protein
MAAIKDVIPGGLASLVTSGGGGLGNLEGSGGLSRMLSNLKLKNIPNFAKLTTNYQKFPSLPILNECPLLLG